MSSHSGYKKYLSNTSWLFAEKIFRIFINLFITIWLARYLGPEQFGSFNYAISFVALFSVLSTLGLDNLINKELLAHPTESNSILGSSFVLRIVGAILLCILSISIISILRPEDTVMLTFVVIISLTFFFNVFDIIKYWFQSHVQAKYSAIADGITLVISAIVKIILILNEAPLISFVWLILIEAIILSIMLLIIYKIKSNQISKWTFNKEKAKYLLQEAWPLILAGTLYVLYTRVDQIMLGEIVGDASVGIYSAAVRISESWMFIPTIIATSFFPAMLNARKVDYSLYIQRTQHLLNLMAFLGLCAGIGVWFLAEPFISLTFGSHYIDSVNVLVIHIWGAIFIAMSSVSYRYFLAEGLQRSSFYRGLAGFIVNIILNYFLIPLYGAVGAAIATVVSQIMALYLFNFTNTKTRPMFYMQTRALFLLDIFDTLKQIKSLRGNK